MNLENQRFSSTGGIITIQELQAPFEYIKLQFVPQSVSNPRQGRWNGIKSAGADADIQHLMGGDETVSFTAEFYDMEINEQTVMDRVNFLKSLTMQPKRNILLDFGGMFDNYTFVMQQVTPNLEMFMHTNQFAPRKASVSLVLKVDYSDRLNLTNVRNG